MQLSPQQIDHFDRESTGVAHCWSADVVATAKRDLVPGEVLDGEGGYTVWGNCCRPNVRWRLADCRSAWRMASSCCAQWPKAKP